MKEKAEEVIKDVSNNMKLAFIDFEDIYGFNVDISCFQLSLLSRVKYKTTDIRVIIQLRSMETFNRKVVQRRKIISEFNDSVKEAIDKFNILSEYKINDYPNPKLDYSGNNSRWNHTLKNHQLYSDIVIDITY
ncbi:hypothetical protein ABGT15_04365 [Flavobacterium enshiense]|uniref:hypothetical protein n=1 Tax=Flavobacterium enshiense TaxID=1341165 RepID=UPI00345DB284